MAHKGNASSRNGRLQEAIALLLQNQAALVAQHTAFLTDMRELSADSTRQFAAIRQEFDEIRAILLRHERILNDLPEAIRQRIGFKGP